MKKVLSWLASPRVLLLLLLLGLLVICYAGWNLFFPGKERQLGLLLAVACIGVLAVLLSAIPDYLRERRRRRPSDGPVAVALEQALEALGEQSLRRSERFLRVPWILVLGPSGSGKATALSHASFARRVADPRAREPLCWLWQVQSRDAVFVQPGARVRDDEGLWFAFLRWLQRRRPVDAVLLQVAAPQLIGSGADLSVLGGRLAGRLRELGQIRPGIPLVLMVTQCDRIDGFNQFFSELTPRERDAAWGFTVDIQDAELFTPHISARVGLGGGDEQTLISPLWQRTQDAFRRAMSAEARAAVLGFPAEVANLGKALGTFLDAVYPRGLGEGLPRVVEVCFTSATQQGTAVSGARHQLCVRSQLVRARSMVNEPPQLGAFFVRGALARLLDRATAASRPPLRWHFVALGLAVCLCATSSWLLGSFFGSHFLWLEKTQTLTQKMSLPSTLAAGGVRGNLLPMRDELLWEVGLAHLLENSYAQTQGHGLTATAFEQADRFLRCRTGTALINPLLENSSANVKKSIVGDLTLPNDVSIKEKGGETVYRTFKALKALTLLQKRFLENRDGKTCPAISSQDREELARYLAELWNLEGRDHEFLTRAMRDFLKRYFGDGADRAQWPRLTFQKTEKPMGTAKEQLLGLFKRGRGHSQDSSEEARGLAEMYYYMRTSLLDLRDRQALLGAERQLVDERKMERVFTLSGCPQLFNSDDKWGAWLACVRGERVGSDSPQAALVDYYLAKHRTAWSEWLAKLQLKQDLPQEQKAAAAVLRDLEKDLTQIFELVGRGERMQSADGQEDKEKTDKAKGPPDAVAAQEPEVCIRARSAFAKFPYAAGDNRVRSDAHLAGRTAQEEFTAYGKTLTGMSEALMALDGWTKDPAPAFQLHQAGALALSRLAQQRMRLFRELEESGSGLEERLKGVEDDVSKLLQKQTCLFLEKKWSAILDDWSHKYGSGTYSNDTDRGKIQEFLNGKVTVFKTDYVDQLREVAPDELKVIEKAISEATPPSGAPPTPPPLPTPAPGSPVMEAPTINIPAQLSGRCRRPQKVDFDTGGRGAFRCEASTGVCDLRDSVPQLRSAQVSAIFSKPDLRNNRITVHDESTPVAEAGSLAELLNRPRGPARPDGREEVIFSRADVCPIHISLRLDSAESKKPSPSRRQFTLPSQFGCIH